MQVVSGVTVQLVEQLDDWGDGVGGVCQTVLEKSLNSLFSGQLTHLQKTATVVEAVPK